MRRFSLPLSRVSLRSASCMSARAGDPVHWRLAVAFWTAQVVGILLKGPAAPALALLTVATLSIADRDTRWIKVLRPVRGLVLTALIAAPWFVAIERATGGRFFAESLWQDRLSKLVGVQESQALRRGRTSRCRLRAFGRARCFWFPLCSGVGDSGVLRRSGF
jgi:4-amino-4-deoxy-L-arabinose transferase-like glycosyltransferase